MLKSFAHYLLCLTSFGASLTHATELPVSTQYQHSQQQVHDQLRQALEQATVLQDQYLLEKARAWLSYADHEYSEKADRQHIAHIYRQVLDILYAEQRVSLTSETAILPFSARMRNDLWTRIESIKTEAGFRCAYRALAQAEVNLVWAAAEYKELGWRHSREIFASAERLVDQANYLSQQCEGALS